MRSAPVTGHDIRTAMFGTPVAGLRVTRQAHRITETDSDELAVMEARGGWWIARRLSDRVTVWAYPGQDEADDAFDRVLESDPSWVASRPPVEDAA